MPLPCVTELKLTVAVYLTFFSLPVPTSNLYVQLNSLQLCVDPASLLWISLFSRGLLHTLDQVKAFYHLQDSNKVEEHVDIRMDAAQLKVNTVLLWLSLFCLI